MLDIQYIRDNPEIVETKSGQKGYPVNVSALIKVDDQRRDLLRQADDLRRRRHQLNEKVGNHQPDEADQALGRQLKEELGKVEPQLKEVDERFRELLKSVPNMPLDDVVVGDSEAANVITETVNQPPEFTFQPRNHHELGESLDLIDKARAAKIAGSRFAYLKGGLVRLQFAIISWVIDTLTNQDVIARIIGDNKLELDDRPFIPVLPPAMLKTGPYLASSRLNAEEMTYKLEHDDLWLNASAEHTLCTMMMDEVIPANGLPLRLLGYSTSFRREAGTYGKDTEGIFRMHQFDKLEMEVFSTAQSGLQEHYLLIAIQRYLVNQLGLSYQVINKCTADIGKPNARGVDINCWFPGQQAYRETHTADYMTDYQARDLKIRVKDQDGSLSLVHTNDATAFALGRIMAAIMENYQTADGQIGIPEVLKPYMGNADKL